MHNIKSNMPNIKNITLPLAGTLLAIFFCSLPACAARNDSARAAGSAGHDSASAARVNSESVRTDSLTVALLGDSNLWLGGDDCSKPKGWNMTFAKLLGGTCRSYARSGATWSHNKATRVDTMQNVGVLADNNVILNQVMRLKGVVDANPSYRPDIVIISAGANDAWFLTKRPDLFAPELQADSRELTAMQPSEVRSLHDAIKLNCALLRSFLPKARIILLTPLQTIAVDSALLNRVSDTIEHAASELGVESLRLDTLAPIRADEERKKFRLTYDGTHTSVLGARLCGEAIFNAVFNSQRQ